MTAQPSAGPHLLPIDPPAYVYVSGPMTGKPEFNYPAFTAAAEKLREDGYRVFNPAETPGPTGQVLDTTGMTGNEKLDPDQFDLRQAFQEYAQVITYEASAVAVLPGWEQSKGALAEVFLARSIGLPIFDALTGAVVDVDAATARPALAVTPPPTSTSGETRVTSTTGGQKGVKEARYDLIPSGPLRELAVLYGRGNIKYPPEPGELANWKRGYPWSLSKGALLRHLELFWSGEDHDAEMGVKHLTCVAWHAFNLAWFLENRPGFDDRPVAETYEGALPTPQWLIDLASEGVS